MLALAGLMVVPYGAFSASPLAARRVLGDRWGTPARIVAAGARPFLPPWRRPVLVSGTTSYSRRRTQAVIVETERGRFLLPLLTRLGRYRLDAWPEGTELLLV